MGPRKGYYVNDQRFGRGKTDHHTHYSHRSNYKAIRALLILALVLIGLTLVIAAIRYLPGMVGSLFSGHTQQTTIHGSTNPTTSASGATDTQGTTAPTPTLGPTPNLAANNPQLLPAVDLTEQKIGALADGVAPAQRHIDSTIFDAAYKILSSFSRPDGINLLNPLNYNKIPGVLTFRGNNFRNAPAFGLVSLTQKKFSQVWERPVGSLKSSAWSFTWTGTGWTGQPLLVQWDDDVRQLMNINAAKKAKTGLVEVIYATMDGKIYFYDLDDGQPTRDPITVGAPIKGTPCVDPRGYPVLYVGQGDKNSNVEGIGFRVFNLIDESLLLYKECSDTHSYRSQWGACDSSPIFDAAADTLIYPNENGLVYTAKMNTQFNRTTGQLSIDPQFTTYRYKMTGLESFGIESSMSIYGHYGYFSDNSGILSCIDLNTLQPVWSRQLADDSDVTPVLDQQGDAVSLYSATEVDWQQNIVGNYQGSSFVYKIDAMTGKIIWQTSYSCWTKNAADNGDDINGGALGTPVVGKKDLNGLVIFSFCMTKGIYNGDSVVAFNANDGSIAWEYKMNSYSWSSPVDIYDQDGHGYIVIADSSGQLHLIDGKTGEALDVLQLTKNNGADKAGNIESSCAIFGNRLVIGTRGNVIIGVELK